MPQPIELNLRPTGANSLAWSPDGTIAIAGSTEIHLLLPRARSRAPHSTSDLPDPDDDEWEHIYFENSSFPSVLWPTEVYSKGSTHDYHIAREQRLSEIIDLAWSPPGIASHDGCVLGVLTSNGFLSVVVPGMGEGSAAWARRAVIRGRRVEARREETTEGERAWEERNVVGGMEGGARMEAMRGVCMVDGQVRAWCWAPGEWNGRELDRKRVSVVVVTDEVVVLVSMGWEGETLVPRMEAELRIPTEERADGMESLMEAAGKEQHGFHVIWVQHVAPDAMVLDEPATDSKAYLLVSFRGCIRQIVVSNGTSETEEPPSMEWCDGEIEGHGPIAVTHQRLYYSHEDELRTIPYAPQTFSTSAKTPNKHSSSILEGWDTPDALIPFTTGVLVSQILSLVSFSSQTSNVLQTTYLTSNSTIPSRLAREIRNCRQEFAEENDLEDRAAVRLHGIATYIDENTGKQWVTALIALAPSEQIQYKLKTNERSTLVFSHEDLEFQSTNSQREQNGTAAHVNGHDDDDDAYNGPVFPWCADTSITNVGHDVVSSQILNLMPKLHLASSPETKRIALLQLFTHLVLQSPNERIQTALDVLKTYDDGAWQKARGGLFEGDFDTSMGTIQTVNSLIQITEADGTFRDMLEHCAIPGCGSPLGFGEGEESIDEAKCEGKGHIYGRCGLTLLAIQQPYISKTCGSCSRRFLDEAKIPEDSESTRAVIAHFKRCPFCGGKFVG